MNNQLVVVFGASGFLGRHTVRALALRGYRIRAVTRHPARANDLPPMGRVGQIQLCKADVCEPVQVASALKGAHFAVNLVGILYARGEQSFDAVHVQAAGSIGEAAQKQGLFGLVHISALGAAPDSPSQYAKSKFGGESRIRAAFPSAAILRPSIVFGPEDKFFNRFAGLARSLPALPLVGGGRTRFQPVFAGDVASAIANALEDNSARGKTFELGGPVVYTFRELLEFILREIERRRVLIPIPFVLASVQAFFLQFLPSPLLTPDQVELLKADNVVQSGALTLQQLGIEPRSIEAEVSAYLWRFRPKGQYESSAALSR